MVLLSLGLPALVLLGLTHRGLVTASIGLGIVVPLLAFAALVEADVRAGSIMVALFVGAAGCAVAVLLFPGPGGRVRRRRWERAGGRVSDSPCNVAA